MAKMDVTFTPNWGAVRAMSQKSGPIGRAVTNAGDSTEKRARSLAPVKTGRLKTSIKRSQLKVTDNGPSTEVTASVPYARPVHQGGRRNRRARPFLTDALRQLKTTDFRE